MIQRLKLLIIELIHKLNYTHIDLNKLDNIENEILLGLKKEGFFVLKSFLSNEECEYLQKRTDIFIINNKEKVSFESNGHDKRIYRINKYDNSFILKSIEDISDKIYSRFSFIFKKDFFYLLGKINAGKENLGSGSGWHRDSPISNQFKTILYLSDVSEHNGPFQYIPKSHISNSLIKTSKHLGKKLNDRRYSEEEIELLTKNNIIPELKSFIAPKGTLIFVNTRGLHRGAPLEKEERYALTRYHFAKKNKKFN